MTVKEFCSAGKNNGKAYTLQPGRAVYQSGYTSHYNGDACRYEGTAPFGGVALADGDGSDAVPLYSTSHFFTQTALPVQAEFVAFASNQAANVTVGSSTYTLTGTQNGVYKFRLAYVLAFLCSHA